MTCERVVIINRGRVVAEDTPEGLTARMRGSEILRLTVDGPEEKVRNTVGSLPGVVQVKAEAASNGVHTFEVETASGQDIRRELARSIVEEGFGLLELKQMGMSLEDIYLQLTTSEEPEETAPAEIHTRDDETEEPH
jgi:ABC-2 type transport system ATP-binding protein